MGMQSDFDEIISLEPSCSTYNFKNDSISLSSKLPFGSSKLSKLHKAIINLDANTSKNLLNIGFELSKVSSGSSDIISALRRRPC